MLFAKAVSFIRAVAVATLILFTQVVSSIHAVPFYNICYVDKGRPAHICRAIRKIERNHGGLRLSQ